MIRILIATIQLAGGALVMASLALIDPRLALAVGGGALLAAGVAAEISHATGRN